MPTPNDLNTAYDDYHKHPGAESTSVLCASIRAYARKMTRGYKLADPDDAADSILALAWASLEKFRGEAKFATWIHTLSRRRLLNIIQAERRRPAVQMDERRESEVPINDAPLMDVATLTHLSDTERHLVQMLIEQPDYDRLSERLCISRKALGCRLTRILKKREENMPC